ncbi:MAG: TolC family protein [Proteobacteria bacterium]|nr:TolC family protein [Pseudomonadota bacterium]
MKKAIRIFCIFLVTTGVFCHLPSQAAAGETLLGFAEAWQKLTTDNDTLAAARETLDQARHKRDAARDLYLPEIELSASYMRLDDEVTLSPNDIL